uniref:Protein unc-93 homolog A n=1 Tax=Phascolarctos cinereus TaxID=38626 RepID=A0A6P5J4A5_PHACI|nr:protein unc-93 homolog A-like isoform X3 [Phascolarctos cinereus]
MDSNLKNVVIIAIGFLFLFTAYGALQNLQSSLNKEEGLGVTTLSVIYASVILSSMFLPPVLIKKFGCKWTITFSMCCYITFSLGNFYASWFTLIPTAIILGLGAAPLWSAESTYLTTSGNIYAKKTGKLGKDVINQYFGTFYLIFQTSGVWGNLISSLVFQQDPPKGEITKEQLLFCGANDCMKTSTATNSTKHPGNDLIYTLLGIYTGSGILAVLLIAVFLGQLPNDSEENEEEKNIPAWTRFLATFQHLKDKRQCFLIPLTMYSGFEQGFISGDYTKSYVTCALGIHNVGFVMICFSGATSLCSLMFGKLSQYTGRKVLYAIAIYGVLFVKNKEAAFANYRLWESLGFVIAFGYSTFLCVYVKLYIVLSVLILSVVLYGIVEVLEHTKPPETSGSEEKESQAEEMDTQRCENDTVPQDIFF